MNTTLLSDYYIWKNDFPIFLTYDLLMSFGDFYVALEQMIKSKGIALQQPVIAEEYLDTAAGVTLQLVTGAIDTPSVWSIRTLIPTALLTAVADDLISTLTVTYINDVANFRAHKKANPEIFDRMYASLPAGHFLKPSRMLVSY